MRARGVMRLVAFYVRAPGFYGRCVRVCVCGASGCLSIIIFVIKIHSIGVGGNGFSRESGIGVSLIFEIDKERARLMD